MSDETKSYAIFKIRQCVEATTSQPVREMLEAITAHVLAEIDHEAEADKPWVGGSWICEICGEEVPSLIMDCFQCQQRTKASLEKAVKLVELGPFIVDAAPSKPIYPMGLGGNP